MGRGGTELTIISVYSISLFSETSLLLFASFSKSRRKFCERLSLLLSSEAHINDTTATCDLINSAADRTEPARYLPLIHQLQSVVNGRKFVKVGSGIGETRNLRIRCCLNRTRARSSWIFQRENFGFKILDCLPFQLYKPSWIRRMIRADYRNGTAAKSSLPWATIERALGCRSCRPGCRRTPRGNTISVPPTSRQSMPVREILKVFLA